MLKIGDTVRRIYYPRPRWYSRDGERKVEGLVLGVIVDRFEATWVTVEWEDGSSCRGDEGCFRKVSGEEATAIRMVPFRERSKDTENPEAQELVFWKNEGSRCGSP